MPTGQHGFLGPSREEGLRTRGERARRNYKVREVPVVFKHATAISLE
jgi:hypothetical protein